MKIRFLCAALACAVPVVAVADADRDRIATERAGANAKLAAQERECETRFMVAPCLEAARREHRAFSARLRQQQLQLDEARRHEAAAARRRSIAEKVEAQQARASDAAPEPPRVRVRRATEAGTAPIPAERFGPSAAALEASAVRRNEEKFEARAQAARAHREAVARRNAQRATQGKAVAPLPAPPGASAPR